MRSESMGATRSGSSSHLDAVSSRSLLQILDDLRDESAQVDHAAPEGQALGFDARCIEQIVDHAVEPLRGGTNALDGLSLLVGEATLVQLFQEDAVSEMTPNGWRRS